MRLYRLLLHLYPVSFRSEYGDEMAAIFARRMGEAEGPFALLILWWNTLIEVFANASAAHTEILRQDLRYVVRSLRGSPGFAFTAILVVALGIGATTAAFSVADHVLIRPLPFRDPEQVVKLWETLPSSPRLEPSPPNYRDWKQMSTSFEQMAAFRGLAANLVGAGAPEVLHGASVTANLFAMLGVQPALGRLFTEADDRESSPGTVLLSDDLWKTQFAGDSNVLGRAIRLDDVPYVVIGVMPPDFAFPSRDAQIWTAMRFAARDFQDRNNYYLQVIARLKPGVSLERARAEMHLIATQLQREYPKENRHTGAIVIRLRDEISDRSRLLMFSLCAAAFCVLLIACTNLANLLLARAMARGRELAVRTALGSGQERLVRQLLTESLFLAGIGGTLGVLLAFLILPLLIRVVPNTLPIADVPSIDFRVLAFAALLSGITGISFGVLPAHRVFRHADLTALREGARSSGGRKQGARSALVIAEVMVTAVLLVCSGLLLRALRTVEAVNPGFRAADVLTLRTELPMPKFEKTAPRTLFYHRVLSEIAALPGVMDAAYISFLPMEIAGAGIWPVAVDGRLPDPATPDRASLRFVTPGFFAALRIPLRMGRDVSDSDTVQRPFVAVVSESFARRNWPGQSPLGRHFQFAFEDRTVVGVVGDIRVRGLERQSEPQVYVPYQQARDGQLVWYAPKDLVVRSSTEPATLVAAIRRIVAGADSSQPVSDVQMLDRVVSAQTAPRAVQIRMVAAFAGLAFLLAAIGIHGVLSFAVSQRSREIGVRIALGARPRDVLSAVLRSGAMLALAGVIPGLLVAYAAARAMQALLAGVSPSDAATFVLASALCMLIALAGSLLPALRAVRVDPITAIRAE